MQIKINRKIGDANAQFDIDERDPERALEYLTFLATPDDCYLEGFRGKPVEWRARRVKGKEGTPKAGQEFIYIERRVRGDDGRWATSQMGKFQSGGLFWKQWEIYDPNQKRDNHQPADEDTGGVPF